MSLSSAAGWLLDITKLTLGENIGEGEFGGELSLYLVFFTCFYQPLCTLTKFQTYSLNTKKSVVLVIECSLMGDFCVCVWFSAVYEGDYMGQRVAVKTIKCDVTAQAFLQETTVMTWVWRCFSFWMFPHLSLKAFNLLSKLNKKSTQCDHISVSLLLVSIYFLLVVLI